MGLEPMTLRLHEFCALQAEVVHGTITVANKQTKDIITAHGSSLVRSLWAPDSEVITCCSSGSWSPYSQYGAQTRKLD